MEKSKRYELEGLLLDIPLYYDEQAKMYIENYPDFIEKPVYTPQGHRVLFSGTDICFHVGGAPHGCADCGSCPHYQRAGEHTWIGICLKT